MAEEAPQRRFTVRTRQDEGDALLVSLAGRVSLVEADRLLDELQTLPGDRPIASVRIDLAELTYLDSAGVLVLWRWEKGLEARGIPLAYDRIPEEIRRIRGLVAGDALEWQPQGGERRSQGILERVGGVSFRFFHDFVALMTFLGDLLAALAHLAFHPREMRWDDLFFYMRRTGADGLPIVALISLLIGMIIAFMSSLQLKQFGANIYVASLVAVAIVRELGPIMTAILVAGRSASAYAAEIGTMQVNDEVDALATMGFDPIRFLALPKLIATVLVLPLLTLYADLFGILGGMIVGITGLDLTAHTFLMASQRSITLFFLFSSLAKSLVFAFVIAWIGCQRGFQVRGGVAAVGEATTSAVVTSILLIVIVDSAFAVVLHYIR